MKVRRVKAADISWIRGLLRERWGSPQVMSRGRSHQADKLPGFIAVEDDRRAGLITHDTKDDQCEIVSLDSLESGRGIGTALVKAVRDEAFFAGCRRVWLITTNDNTGALRFYQKIGFDLVAIHRNAVQRSRMLKPSIPECGIDDIPIRHEVELEISFTK